MTRRPPRSTNGQPYRCALCRSWSDAGRPGVTNAATPEGIAYKLCPGCAQGLGDAKGYDKLDLQNKIARNVAEFDREWLPS